MKGRSTGDVCVMLNENEINRLSEVGNAASLYIVMNCKNETELYRFQNPAKALKFELNTKEMQYFLPMVERKDKVIIESNFKMLESGHQAIALLKKSSHNTNQERKQKTIGVEI